jgi:serine/threonine protein phosphatase PrpC
MRSLLTYNPSDDQSVYQSEELELKTAKLVTVRLAACTYAGRSDYDQPQRPNEDAYGAMQPDSQSLLIAVFDGTSNITPITGLKDQTGARFASHFLKAKLEELTLIKDPAALLIELNEALLHESQRVAGARLDDVHSLPCSAATVAVLDFNTGKLAIGHLGDTFAWARMKDSPSCMLTDDLNRVYDQGMFDLIRQIAARERITPREAYTCPEVKQALLDKNSATHNHPDGKGVGLLNGDPVAEQYIQSYEMPMGGITDILLGSDGLVPPDLDGQDDTDREEMFALLDEGGLQVLIERKRAVEDADPDRHLVRYKHSDDATGVWVRLAQE